MSGASRLGVAAGLLAFGIDVLYLAVIGSQDGGFTSRVWFVAATIVAAGTCALIGATRPSAEARVRWLALATGAGSGSAHSIGTGVVGGMLTATVLVIFWVPLFFVGVTALFKTPRKTERNGEAR